MSVRCGYASIDENGNASGGQLGDQTKREVLVGTYYQFGQNEVFRLKDQDKALRFADMVEAVCKNDYVGYDQSRRVTLYSRALEQGYIMKNITTPCACDCSSLVACCLNGVGISVSYVLTTSSIHTVLSKNDNFIRLTDANLLAGHGLLAGDIVNCPGKHVITILRQTENTGKVTKDQVVSSNAYLTDAQQETNARYIWQWLRAKGWTNQSIAGVFGSMDEESGFNPGIWQGLEEGDLNGGFGLVQWTPATKLIDWANANVLSYTDVDTQLKRIEWERANGEQYYKTDAYPLTFEQFVKSTLSPDYLAICWVANYERPNNPEQSERGVLALAWYEKILAWEDGYVEDGEDSGIVDQGSIYSLLLKTPFVMASLSENQQNFLKTISIGDNVHLKFTFNRRKREIGTNYFGNRLTFDNQLYTISGIKRNGFLQIVGKGEYFSYINPNYVKE